VFRVPGTESLPRGTAVRVRVAGIDLLTLELHATLLARLEAPAAADEAGEDTDDEAEPAGALQLAIDVAEPAAAEAAGDGVTPGAA
jgi:exoribonuclease II